MSTPAANTTARFRSAYAEQRHAEGRGARAELLQMPYVRTGRHARSWAVRARTYDRFVAVVIAGAARPLRVLDLGAGSGWLCHRLRLLGHEGVALDLRTDDVDGLGAAAVYGGAEEPFERVAASFEALPLAACSFDVVVFNAALHYAERLDRALAEAVRVLKPAGRIAILDSPFYAREADGLRMVEQKRLHAAAQFGERAEALMALPFIEFLTRERLAHASAELGLSWRRHRVPYPAWYELRPVLAALRGVRAPSRFDLWEATVP